MSTAVASEVAAHADFSRIRYAQCWEDADVLLPALALTPGARCLSVCSAGDNSLALLTRDPAAVTAVDLSPAQLACLELRVAAYARLDHEGLLGLLGSHPHGGRARLYAHCRELLSPRARRFWDARPVAIQVGIAAVGRFERWFRLFRRAVLPLIHRRRTVERLLQPRAAQQRARFYDDMWDSPLWRGVFQVFFSRRLMGALGRDPAFFRYVEGSVGARILDRARHALRHNDPASNPYLHWILNGRHHRHLPLAWRAEHFHHIRANLPRLHWRLGSIEEVLADQPAGSIQAVNASDICEYMSTDHWRQVLTTFCRSASPGARIAYWNMLAPRSRPDELAKQLQPLPELSQQLWLQDQAFFYSRLVIEEVRAGKNGQ